VEDDKLRTKAPVKDYYYILGISPNATTEEIHEAYFGLQERFEGVHDLDPEAQSRAWNDIATAWEILKDTNKRKEYDKNAAFFRQTSDVRALWTKVTSGVQSVVQQGQTQELKTAASRIQAQSLELEIEVSLKEAMKGCHRQIIIQDPKACEECINLKPVNRMQCTTCRGVGHYTIERRVEIDLPKGLYEGMEIRKTGLGKWDLRATNYGDLVLRIILREHPVLAVSGKDITVTLPITLYESVLGAEIEVPTATGKGLMKIQPLTQPGRVYRLKGLGLAGGDQLVTIEVAIPQQLSAEEVKLFQKLKEQSKMPNPRESIYAAMHTAS
jgi:DnaJ-class molecular chaperone